MRALWILAALLISISTSFAADAPAAAGDKPTPLFDGKSLDGWKIITCQVQVKDECIHIKGGNGVIRPDRTFKDFILELDWKALKAEKWDSGIYIRCKDPSGTWPWPKVYQVNLRQGDEGNMAELKEARSKDLSRPGEWNHFKLTVVGTKAELEINGKLAWKADGLAEPEGFISLQAEVPGGGEFLFKNITIQELKK